MNNALNLSSGPHVRDSWTTRSLMCAVILALTPTAVVGVIVNGLHALLIILVSIVSAVAAEFVFDKICKKPNTFLDCSAVVTGLLLALSLSPAVPLYAPAIGAVFAILVVKCCFGGLGKNFINPALAGRCFLLISFGSAMTRYVTDPDAVTTATPVALLNAGETVDVTQMFLGTAGGVIGSSILAMLVGGLALWALDIIHGEICFAVLGGFTLFMAIFGGHGFDLKYLAAHLCGGGVVMGAFFMATDYTTSPVSKLGQLTYGCVIGVLGAMFRLYGSSADSFSYSIIIANLLVPLIDMYIIPKPYAYRKDAIALRNGEEKKPFWKKIPRPVVILAVITLLAGLALSGVYSLTADTIEAQRQAASIASYRVVVPQAESFDTDESLDQAVADLSGETYGTDFGRCRINEVVVGKDAAGEIAGYAISVTSSDGYDGDITLSLGVDPEGKVNGIVFTELHETPGMGMRCGDEDFMSQFAGKAAEKFSLNKAGTSSSDDEIASITGASTTSGAVVNAVNAGLDFFRNTVKGGA